MKTVQITIDVPLLAEVDQVVSETNTTRSAFIQDAVQLALRHRCVLRMEAKHEAGYRQHPSEPGEFDVWEREQIWGAE
jgi:metal-responsive CopG/Arc/MetJ family transcriptional regulator